MRTIPAALQTHLAAGETTLAACLKITRADAQVFAYTEHDRELTVSSVVYKPILGARSNASAGDDLSVPNFDIASVIDDDGLSEDDLASGRFDGAEIELFLVNWQNPDDGVIVLSRGFLGEVRREGIAFFAEARGLSDRLSQVIGEKTTPFCRAVLGDGRCKVNLAPFTVTGTVLSVTSARRLTATFGDLPGSGAPPTENYFNLGVLTWITGANAGGSHEVRKHEAGGVIELYLPAYFTVSPGDTFSVHAGCRHDIADCRDRFSNIANFTGEPHVPGVRTGLRTPWSAESD